MRVPLALISALFVLGGGVAVAQEAPPISAPLPTPPPVVPLPTPGPGPTAAPVSAPTPAPVCELLTGGTGDQSATGGTCTFGDFNSGPLADLLSIIQKFLSGWEGTADQFVEQGKGVLTVLAGLLILWIGIQAAINNVNVEQFVAGALPVFLLFSLIEYGITHYQVITESVIHTACTIGMHGTSGTSACPAASGGTTSGPLGLVTNTWNTVVKSIGQGWSQTYQDCHPDILHEFAYLGCLTENGGIFVRDIAVMLLIIFTIILPVMFFVLGLTADFVAAELEAFFASIVLPFFLGFAIMPATRMLSQGAVQYFASVFIRVFSISVVYSILNDIVSKYIVSEMKQSVFSWPFWIGFPFAFFFLFSILKALRQSLPNLISAGTSSLSGSAVVEGVRAGAMAVGTQAAAAAAPVAGAVGLGAGVAGASLGMAGAAGGLAAEGAAAGGLAAEGAAAGGAAAAAGGAAEGAAGGLAAAAEGAAAGGAAEGAAAGEGLAAEGAAAAEGGTAEGTGELAAEAGGGSEGATEEGASEDGTQERSSQQRQQRHKKEERRRRSQGIEADSPPVTPGMYMAPSSSPQASEEREEAQAPPRTGSSGEGPVSGGGDGDNLSDGGDGSVPGGAPSGSPSGGPSEGSGGGPTEGPGGGSGGAPSGGPGVSSGGPSGSSSGGPGGSSGESAGGTQGWYGALHRGARTVAQWIPYAELAGDIIEGKTGIPLGGMISHSRTIYNSFAFGHNIGRMLTGRGDYLPFALPYWGAFLPRQFSSSPPTQPPPQGPTQPPPQQSPQQPPQRPPYDDEDENEL